MVGHFFGFQYLVYKHQALDNLFYRGMLRRINNTGMGIAIGGELQKIIILSEYHPLLG